MEFVVRRLSADDAEIAVGLVGELSAKSVSPEYMRRLLSNAANYLFAAHVDGRPAGFLFAHRLERLKEESYKLFVYEVDVAAAYRRMGIGMALMERVKMTVENESMICAFVFTDYRNRGAVEFYKSTGGVPENGDDLMFVYSRRTLNPSAAD